MNKREARKEVLRWTAQQLRVTAEHDLRPHFGESATGAGPNRARLVAQMKHLADHLEWEADGRRSAIE